MVAASDDGTITAVFGSGREGFADGGTAEASFSSPQGLIVASDTLYGADTDNHAMRAINLIAGEVTTLAGSGVRDWPPIGGPVVNVELNSPWALEPAGDDLCVAKVGTHQIWTIDLASATARPSGRERRRGHPQRGAPRSIPRPTVRSGIRN